MIRRLATVLGILTVGIVVVIAGPVLPASADLIFGDCTALVSVIVGACPGDTGASVLNWHSAITGNVTTESFLKLTGTPNGTTQFVDAVDGDQSGLGITSQVGANIFDNEITNFPIVRNGISILPVNPPSHTGTISIDSLQTLPAPLVGQETAEVCAEPTAGVFGGLFCTSTALNGQVAQTIPLPPGFSATRPWLAVDATGSVLSDVKIRDFDLAAVAVPEPATVALVLTGMVGLVLARRRRNLI
jgi:PEP-CTERM motif-containing protein